MAARSRSGSPIAAVVLAAGLGTRMRSRRSKVLHALAGRPLIGHLIATLERLKAARIVVVVGPEGEPVAKAVAPHATQVQRERLGTGHAARAALPALKGFKGDVLVLFGDTPLVRAETLRRMIRARRSPARPAIVLLGFRPADPGAYGRIVTGPEGVERIVEARDAGPAERRIGLCNSGAMLVAGAHLGGWLKRLKADNAKREFYLTDIVAMARRAGERVAVVEGEADELVGINSRAELAAAEAILQGRLRAAAMAGGATLIAPETVHFAWDTRLGRDVTVGPFVVFGPGVTVEDEATIGPFCHLEGARVAAGAKVGPFARLRPGADIGEGARVGNFVEVKNARFGPGAKANHLAYVGDATVGRDANIGAGTITCNYDGIAKHRTEIGAGAFIGSNSALVAPVTIGAGAVVGAGSAIAKDVAPGALALTRAPQREIADWVRKRRGKTT